MDLIKLSIKRPSVLIVMLSLLLLGGFYSYKLLNYELIPKFEVNVVTISTIYPGASPSEVESTVTKRIEDAVSALENIKKIQSYSYESLSVVVVQLTNDANVDNTLNEAQRKINAIRANLPTDAKEPSLSKFSLSDLPIVSIGVTSKLSSQELYDLVDKKIQPELSRVPGVAQVNIIGGRKREIRVNVDAKKLEGYGLSIGQVQQLIAASNMEIPAGKIKTRENSTSIRLLGKIQDVEQLRNLTLASQNGVEIRLSDVADVQDTEEEAEKIAKELNNNKAKVISIEKKEVKKYPGKLFSLGKVQSELSKNHKMDFDRSLKIIQKLYEEGYITYPRTNTEYLAEEEKDRVESLIDLINQKGYNLEFKDSKKIFDTSKIESHSALTPTLKLPEKLSKEEEIVYQVIFNRFISNFLAEETIVSETTLTIKVADKEFKLKGTEIIKQGFYAYEPKKFDNQLPNLAENEEFEVNFLAIQKETEPPKKVTESELGNYLEHPFRKEIKEKNKKA